MIIHIYSQFTYSFLNFAFAWHLLKEEGNFEKSLVGFLERAGGS